MKSVLNCFILLNLMKKIHGEAAAMSRNNKIVTTKGNANMEMVNVATTAIVSAKRQADRVRPSHNFVASRLFPMQIDRPTFPSGIVGGKARINPNGWLPNLLAGDILEFIMVFCYADPSILKLYLFEGDQCPYGHEYRYLVYRPRIGMLTADSK
ncbi:hypothetical protein E3N88_40934 [Mikania micrantha]|uniref:Uncharacterized protein n=1 Tax=Mikania micrantha TaxID=192012 RepID=A0A5N6LP42_9ASTR|nr:hypothetical protein E3N88_40934 [Mikania micrantha]